MAEKCCCKYRDEAGRIHYLEKDIIPPATTCDRNKNPCPKPPPDHPKWKFITACPKDDKCSCDEPKTARAVIEPDTPLEEAISAVKQTGEWEGDFTVGSNNLLYWEAKFTGPDGEEIDWPPASQPIQGHIHLKYIEASDTILFELTFTENLPSITIGGQPSGINTVVWTGQGQLDLSYSKLMGSLTGKMSNDLYPPDNPIVFELSIVDGNIDLPYNHIFFEALGPCIYPS